MQERDGLIKAKAPEGATPGRGKGRRSQFNTFAFQLLTLLVITLAIAATLTGFVAIRYKTLLNQRTSSHTALSISEAVIAIGNEVIDVVQEADSTLSRAAVDKAVSALEGMSDRAGLDIAELRRRLTFARGTTFANFSSTFLAYDRGVELLFSSFFLMFSRQLDPSVRALSGLSCLSSELVPLNTHFALLSEYFTPWWDMSFLSMYLGSSVNRISSCETLLPDISYIEAEEIEASGPSLRSIPSEITYSALSARALEELLVQESSISIDIEGLSREVKSEWTHVKTEWIGALVLSSASCVILTLLFFSISYLASKQRTVSETEVMREYHVIEGKSKLTNRLSQVLLSGSEDPQLLAVFSGTFLDRVIDLVARLRPMIPQTSFGDIENVVLSSTNQNSNVRSDDTSAAQAEDMLRFRDLRTDLGMLIVSGTVMTIALPLLNPTVEMDSPESEKKRDLREQERRASHFIGSVRSIANAHRGVVYTVTGDVMIVVWNITNSSSAPDLLAVHAALAIVHKLGDEFTISIGIAHSTLTAGNVELSGRKALALCGPCVVRSEKLQALNVFHGTSIIIDAVIARTLSKMSVEDLDFSVCPIFFTRSQDLADEANVVHAVYPYRMFEKLKGWSIVFKDFPRKLRAEMYSELLSSISAFERSQLDDRKRRGAAVSKGGSIDQTVALWKRLLHQLLLKEISLKSANTAGNPQSVREV